MWQRSFMLWRVKTYRSSQHGSRELTGALKCAPTISNPRLQALRDSIVGAHFSEPARQPGLHGRIEMRPYDSTRNKTANW